MNDRSKKIIYYSLIILGLVIGIIVFVRSGATGWLGGLFGIGAMGAFGISRGTGQTFDTGEREIESLRSGSADLESTTVDIAETVDRLESIGESSGDLHKRIESTKAKLAKFTKHKQDF